jgi:tryptophan synthase alpha chain
VGFGIRDPAQAAAIAAFADAAVVGSAIVNRIADAHMKGQGREFSPAGLVEDALSFCQSLAKAVHEARA